MIPGDLASRLRMLTEASFFSGEPTVAPLARVKGIPDQFPDFTPGQRIVANLQAPRADNTFQARVSGREVTLALPESVKAGDTLELIVSHVTPRAVFATLAPTSADTAAATRPALSQAGRLISFLLTGQPAAETARLNGGEPLLAAPPVGAGSATALANRLGDAVGRSGLFYESHQARWLAGQVDAASLKQEPQSRIAAESASLPASGSDGAMAATARTAEHAAPIPERLLPLVHQQLDALATHQLVWQGQVWPGQNMEWEIEDPRREGSGEDEPEPYWNTTLRLSLPSLGGVEARLHLTPAGVAMRLIADSEATREALDAGQQRLADALAAADVPLTGLVAERRSAP
ncbi:flagellar hook-length control protein FliK [Zoogloea sp.]|uniref:flagellar hook-length control protein FliK n=1 Tax=Zoogloea sp. TaxID=49181 RepID=UPI0035B3335A